MPTKIKWLWGLCCVFVFFGFIYVSMKTQIEEAGVKRAQERAARMKQSAASAERRQKKMFAAGRGVKDIRELIAMGKPAAAAELARKVLQKNPDNAQAYTWWGISLVKTNRLGEAIEKFRQALQLAPRRPRPLLYWGLTLSMQKKYKEAIEKYRAVIELDSENSNAYAYWGGALAGLREYRKAIDRLQKALDINPFNETAYGVLVDAYYHTGQFSKAWEAVFNARKRNVPLAKDSLERLRRAMPEPAP